MLRSLVGSEMCIRDRLSGSRDAFLHVYDYAQNPSLLKAIPAHNYAIYHCLLYTSDAADDLLCVDLGGRRILKKKKTHTLHQGLKH